MYYGTTIVICENNSTYLLNFKNPVDTGSHNNMPITLMELTYIAFLKFYQTYYVNASLSCLIFLFVSKWMEIKERNCRHFSSSRPFRITQALKPVEPDCSRLNYPYNSSDQRILKYCSDTKFEFNMLHTTQLYCTYCTYNKYIMFNVETRRAFFII